MTILIALFVAFVAVLAFVAWFTHAGRNTPRWDVRSADHDRRPH